MKKDASVFLEHILESINRIDMYMQDKTEADLLQSVDLQDKILYRLVIIGEATNKVPKEIQLNHPEIDWRGIVGLRNILIHEYFGVNLQEVFETLRKDLPVFKKQVEILLSTIK